MSKICHLTSIHKRGDTRIFVKECSALARHGYDVHMIVADDLGPERLNQVEIHDLGKPRNALFRLLVTDFKLFRKCLKLKAVICHFHDPELVIVGFMLSLFGKKVIYDVHEDFPVQVMAKEYIPIIVRRFISKGFSFLEWLTIRRFKLIVASTDFIEKKYKCRGYNAIAIKNYPKLDDIEFQPTDWDKKENALCYIGSLRSVRGVDTLVECLSEIDHATLYMAGGFDEQGLREEVEQMEAWNRVDYLGFIDRQGINEVLLKSKVGMVTLKPLPNYLDSLPIKMFEYMAAGIPVIASDFPFWEQIIDESQCGICVDPNSKSEIVNATKTLLEDSDKAYQMGQKGLKAVREIYNWEIQEKILIKSYKKLM